MNIIRYIQLSLFHKRFWCSSNWTCFKTFTTCYSCKSHQGSDDDRWDSEVKLVWGFLSSFPCSAAIARFLGAGDMSYNLKCFERLNRMVCSFVLVCASFCLWLSFISSSCLFTLLSLINSGGPWPNLCTPKKNRLTSCSQDCSKLRIPSDMMWYVQSVGSKVWQFRDHLALKTGCTTFYNVVFWIIDGTSPGLVFPKKTTTSWNRWLAIVIFQQIHPKTIYPSVGEASTYLLSLWHVQAPHWEHDETNGSCERKCLWNLNWHFKVEPELSMHLPIWWATWVTNARIMFGNNKCWFKEILDGWYNSKCFHLAPWCATDHVTHQPGIKPEPCFLCINLLLTISVPTCLFRRFVPSSCTCYCSIGKRNNLWDIGKKYWTWPFQVVYFPMLEIKYMFFEYCISPSKWWIFLHHPGY